MIYWNKELILSILDWWRSDFWQPWYLTTPFNAYICFPLGSWARENIWWLVRQKSQLFVQTWLFCCPLTLPFYTPYRTHLICLAKWQTCPAFCSQTNTSIYSYHPLPPLLVPLSDYSINFSLSIPPNPFSTLAHAYHHLANGSLWHRPVPPTPASLGSPYRKKQNT